MAAVALILISLDVRRMCPEKFWRSAHCPLLTSLHREFDIAQLQQARFGLCEHMKRAGELARLTRLIAEIEQCMSDVADPVEPDCVSWTRSERTQVEELIAQTLDDLQARRRVIASQDQC